MVILKSRSLVISDSTYLQLVFRVMIIFIDQDFHLWERFPKSNFPKIPDSFTFTRILLVFSDIQNFTFLCTLSKNFYCLLVKKNQNVECLDNG